MKLLIVEDHPSSRKLLRVQLEAEGHAVAEATNGSSLVRHGDRLRNYRLFQPAAAGR